MAIKVGKIENLFWSNGSWEKPNAIPDTTEFTTFEDILPDWLDAKRTGTIILLGEDWNYAYCEGNYYFLQRVQLLDRDNDVYLYSLIKDWWANWIERGVVVKGFCTRTNKEDLILENLDYVEPTIDNPCNIKRLNLNSDLQKEWYQDLDLRGPQKTREQFLVAAITEADWFNFIEDVAVAPIKRTDFSSAEKQYQRGVWIIGELQVKTKVARWKQEVYDKLQWLIANKEKYILSKVTRLGEVTFKNNYCLTHKQEAIGALEETARVERLDFSNLFDIVPDSKFYNQENFIKPFEQQNLKRTELSSKHSVSETDKHRHKGIKVLQRKVYFPYPRVSWALNKNYLFRGYLEPTLISSGRAQSTTLASYTELDPFIPLYQGSYAQGVKSKSKPEKKFWLSYSNHLNVTFNYRVENDTINQGAGWLDGKIPFFSELSPPEFGFLIFNFFKNRKDWNYFHYISDKTLLSFPVLIGLREGWDRVTRTSYDRTTGNWVKEVSKWYSSFSLLNSLYPLAWLFYFTALKDNKIELREKEWNDWATDSGFFHIAKKFEQIINFSSSNTLAAIGRNIDNKLLDLDYIDKVREDYIAKNALLEYQQAYLPIEKDDIFFSDLQAFWEELPEEPYDFKYRPELSWYLDVSKDHLKNKKKYKESPEKENLICYFDGHLQKFCLGVYHTYWREHKLQEGKEQDIEQVQFRETNVNTTLGTEPVTEGVKLKNVTYHHIKPIAKPIDELRLDFSDKSVFIQWAKGEGLSTLREIDRLITDCRETMQYLERGIGWHITGWTTTILSDAMILKYLQGKEHQKLLELPKLPSGDYDFEAVYDLLYSFGASYEENDNVFYNRLDQGLPSYRGYFHKWSAYNVAGVDAVLGGSLGTREREASYEASDIIRFNTGKKRLYLIQQTRRKIIPYLVNLIKKALDKQHKLRVSSKYEFDSPAEVIENLNTENLQKAIYQNLGLLTEEKLIVPEDINITNKLFELRGTNYLLYIDLKKIPHLIFKDIAVNSDLNLRQKRTFSTIEGELPSQDLVDLINQQNSIQIVTTQYPLQERLVFSKIPKHFNIETINFSVEGKLSPSDYWIVRYQGARQLIDVKVAIPKRMTAEGAERDLLAIEQLNLEREKWREDLRERNLYFQATRKRELEELKFAKDRLHYETAFKTMQTAWAGTKVGLGVAGLFAGHYVKRHTTDNTYTPPAKQSYIGKALGYFGNPKTFGGSFTKQTAAPVLLGGVQRLSQAYHSLGLLNVQKEDLASQIEATVAELEYKNYELQREHHYQERDLALKLSTIANVYEQGEVTDRDINDRYNKEYGLSEVHLIYRTPSTVQKEGIERYYKLYGVDCQIPDVVLRINKALEIGSIWKFDYINEIENLFKFEEKELLKSILANGIKILKLSKPVRTLLPEKALSWEERLNNLLTEGSPQERESLFTKLQAKVDQVKLIKQLAEHLPNKDEKLLELIVPLVDQETLLENVVKRGTPEEKEKLVLAIVDGIETKNIFEHLLEKEDKEKLIESWADDTPKLANVLWDKFAHITVGKDAHDSAIAVKDGIISKTNQQLRLTKATLKDKEGEITTLKGDKVKLNADLTQANRNYLEAKKKYETTNTKLTTVTGERDQLKLEKEKFDAQKEAWKTEKENLNKEVAKGAQWKNDLDKVTKEKETLNTEKESIQEDLDKEKRKVTQLTEQVKALEGKPTGTTFEKTVDYLITKKTEDKVAICIWNKEKGIYQEQPDLIIKRRDETRLLRIANTKEDYNTDQYLLWSWYRNQHGSKYNITVSTFSVLNNYLDGEQAKNLHAWVGRYSVEVDKNIPYLDANGNWVKSYWYHLTKGWFDYQIEGSKEVKSYEEYLELSKNEIEELRKKLKETEDSLEAVREIEKANICDPWAPIRMANASALHYDMTKFANHYVYAIKASNTIYWKKWNAKYLIWEEDPNGGIDIIKIWGYKSHTWSSERIDLGFIYDIVKEARIDGPFYSIKADTSDKLNNISTDSSDNNNPMRMAHRGKNAIVWLGDSGYTKLPTIYQLDSKKGDILNANLDVTLYTTRTGFSDTKPSETDFPESKKITKYSEYLDALGLKWDASKEEVVPKSLLS